MAKLSENPPEIATVISSPKSSKKTKLVLMVLMIQMITLYAKGMATRDIQSTLQDMHDVDVSHALISQLTERLQDEANGWQSRALLIPSLHGG